MKLIKYFFAFVLVLLSFTSLAKPKTDIDMKFESSFDSNSPAIPFAVRLNGVKEVYKDSIWGIRVSSIFEDGVEVKGNQSYSFIDDVNFDKQKVETDFFIYKLRFDNLLFGIRKADGDFDLFEYKLSEKSKSIVIRYRLVNSKDDISDEEFSLTLTRN